MSDKRTTNIEVFKDTEKMCKTNHRLIQSIKESNRRQYIVYEKEELTAGETHRFSDEAKVKVSQKEKSEAAAFYKGQKVCVHNFASATNPGGGVVHGSSAQEEAICRCSTLYFNIGEDNIVDGFHKKHRQALLSGVMDATYNDDLVYTPQVTVFKTDSDVPQVLPEKDWYQVDVITCAAPNLRERPSNAMNLGSGNSAVSLTDKELLELHVKRMRRILTVAKKEEAEVVILGAFGCGAFCNSPLVVAEAMARVIEEYKYDFKTIEFAVYCPPGNTANYEAFKLIYSFDVLS